MRDGRAVFQMALDDLWSVVFYKTQVPRTGRVDDGVRPMLAEAEAVYRIDSDLAIHALRS